MDVKDGKVLNPATGRWVNITGKIGKEIMQRHDHKSPGSQTLKEIKEIKAKSKKSKSVKTKSPKQTKPLDRMNSLDSLDKLQEHLHTIKNIKLTTDKYIPFLPMLNEKVPHNDQTIIINNDPFIQGLYDKKIHFVIQHHAFDNTMDLIFRNGDAILLIKDVKTSIVGETCKCDLFITPSISRREVMLSCAAFVTLVFGKTPRLFERDYEYVYPKTYEEEKTIRQYYPAKPGPTISVLNGEDGQYDPCFVSNVKLDTVYVFHVHKTNYNSMKGYIPLGISVVYRTKAKVNYKYTTIFRLTLPSWAICEEEYSNQYNIASYMQEIRNIIISVPFLAKFRGIAPYPRIIIGQVGQKRNQLRSVLNY